MQPPTTDFHRLLSSPVCACLLISAFLCSGPEHCVAQNFEVEGKVTYHVPVANPAVPEQTMPTVFTNRFSVAVDGRRYRLHTDQGNGNSWEADYDGVQLFEFITMRSGASNTCTCLILTNSIPPDDGHCLNYLWLAYASSAYFSDVKTNRLTPIWMLGDPSLLDEGFTLQALWRVQAALPAVPLSVAYMSDGIYRGLDAQKKPFQFAYGPPFSQGFTNAMYTCLAARPVGSLVLPTEFRFTRYHVQGRRLSILNFVEGEATALKEGTVTPPFYPQFSGKAFVIDERFRGLHKLVPTLHYYVTNAHWPAAESLHELHASMVSKAVLADNLLGAHRQSVSVKLVRVVVVLLILAPLLYFVVSLLNKRNKRKELQYERQG